MTNPHIQKAGRAIAEVTSHTEAREALMEATIPSQAANIPTEAREAVARMLYEDWCDGRRKDDFTFETTPNRNAFFFDADAILARLGELGYVQRDRLTSDAAVEAAAKAVWPYMGCEPCEPARHKIPWSGDSTAANKLEKDFARHAVQAAIAAAIEKAQTESYSISGGSLDGSSNLPNTLTSRPNVNRK